MFNILFRFVQRTMIQSCLRKLLVNIRLYLTNTHANFVASGKSFLQFYGIENWSSVRIICFFMILLELLFETNKKILFIQSVISTSFMIW